MKRTLSLVLDDQNQIVLNLTQYMEDKDLDKFTISHFENSEQIREYYREPIAAFLKQHENYIRQVEASSGKKFSGWITLLELQEPRPGEVSLERVRVLYAKYVAILPSIIKNQAVLKEFHRQYNIRANVYGLRKLTSKTSYIVNYFYSSRFQTASVKNVILKWANSNKEESSYYERLRLLIKSYELVRKQLNLPTIDALYKQSRKPILETSVLTLPKKEAESDDSYDDVVEIDGIRYRLDDIPGLESEYVRDSDVHPDGLGPRR